MFSCRSSAKMLLTLSHHNTSLPSQNTTIIKHIYEMIKIVSFYQTEMYKCPFHGKKTDVSLYCIFTTQTGKKQWLSHPEKKSRRHQSKDLPGQSKTSGKFLQYHCGTF
jgi:hypothetical protein